MKHFALLVLLAAFSVAPANAYAANRARPKAAAKCNGSAPCGACKDCRYCKHCAKDGGTCGVCRRRRSADAWRQVAARYAGTHTAH